MRIVFLGTSPFAIPLLDAVIRSDHDLAAVVTRPAKKAGRGRKPTQPPVAEYALKEDLALQQPARLDDPAIDILVGLQPDVMVSAAYGAWLPGRLLSAAPLGVVNVHPSLLPLYRGAAPVARAIMDGVQTTGVTFMITDEGWDTGPVLASFTTPVLHGDTCGTLEDRLSLLAADQLTEVLESYQRGDLIPLPQSGASVYADKISPEEAIIDWGDTAISIERKVRAFQPRPGARTTCRGRLLKIVEVSVLSGDESVPGYVTIHGDTMVVQTGEGALKVLTVQPESKKSMSIAEFLRGARMESGEILGP